MNKTSRAIFGLIAIPTILGMLLFALAAPAFAAAQVTYRQWETITGIWAGGQANGNQTSWVEGEVIPYWLGVTDLSPGTTYAFYITYNHLENSPDACGFLGLAQWDTTVTPNDLAGTATPVPVPGGDFGLVGGTGTLYASDNVINVTVSGPALTLKSSPNQDIDGVVLVTFEIANGTAAEFYWGLHLSTDGACLVGALGAADFNGGSLQTKVEASPPPMNGTLDPGDATALGPSNAVQVMNGAVKQPPTALELVSFGAKTDADGAGFEWVKDLIESILERVGF